MTLKQLDTYSENLSKRGKISSDGREIIYSPNDKVTFTKTVEGSPNVTVHYGKSEISMNKIIDNYNYYSQHPTIDGINCAEPAIIDCIKYLS